MRRLLAVGLILLLSAVPAAASTIHAGSPVIAQSAGQTWIITIEGDVNPSENILSADLFITIDAGVSGDTSTKPLFTAISMDEAGYLFEGETDSPFVGNPTSYVGSSLSSAVALADGVTQNLALVTLDASSASLGTWEWSLSEPGLVTVVNGTSTGLTLNHGTITVTGGVIPEPAMLVQLLGLAGMGGFGLWFRRRRIRGAK